MSVATKKTDLRDGLQQLVGVKKLSGPVPFGNSIVQSHSMRQPSFVERFALDELLWEQVRMACVKYNVELLRLTMIQRLFLTHYRCTTCGILPLKFMNAQHHNKPKCTKCGHLVRLRNRGKYGKIRKEIARSFAEESEKILRSPLGYAITIEGPE